MESFLDHMIFVCFAGAIIGGIMAIFCGGMEYICNKFNWTDKIVKFISEDSADDE